ncbi:response regulator [Clostridium sp. P21]|uniref:Stage 0 sporulation protein A homolog n=1 Tax=Clostridium muellerianum TaxID=2716538 RepID=A0A7Y0EJ37_9CLOT|nr:response regulator [Clostridium muellerianum]NMM64403.1 response regulator [Clostridium muellerianum]
MWKLLIVDDEFRIRKELRNLISCMQRDIEIIGEAENGEQAMNIISEIKPDIMLVDIGMPVISGLEFIENIKERDMDCITIIISSSSEFLHVQKALRLNVFDYLLKPVKSSTFHSAIQNAIKELNRRKSNREYEKWKAKNVEENISLVKKSFLNKLIFGEMNKKGIEQNLKFLKIRKESLSGICVIKLLERFNIENDLRKVNYMIELKSIVEKIMCEEEYNVLIHNAENIIIVFSTIRNKEQWYKVGKNLKKAVIKKLNQIVVVAQSESKGEIAEIKNKYKALLNAISREAKQKPFALMMCNFIQAHYFENDFKISKVAEEFKITPAYVTKILKAGIGCSFVYYLTNVRIESAIEMMKDSTVKIGEVSELVGYSSQHYFSRAFKKVTGESPIKFREKRLLGCRMSLEEM